MKRTASILAGAIALAGLPLLVPASSATAQQPAVRSSLAQINDALGLARSFVGEVQVGGTIGEPVTVQVDLGAAPVVLSLYPHSVRAEDFVARAQLEDGSWIELPPEPVQTYRGTVVGDPGSQVAASFMEDGLHARVRQSTGPEFWIEPLAPHDPDFAPVDHILYRTEDVLDHGGTCDADMMLPFSQPEDMTTPSIDPIVGSVTAELACDTDYEYFQRWGGQTQARIESVVNAINLQYSSEVGISHSITTIIVRSGSNDPYSRKKADQLLGELRSEWNSNQTGVQRDVVHLFTGKSLIGSTIGIAYVGVVCNLNVAYGLVESDFASNFACVSDLSAHELGHNWNANHCSCSSYTMNASITCANQFNPGVTIPAITSYRDAQTCFGAPPTTGSVAGTVTSSGGGAIAGATVQVDSGQSDTTDGSGNYTITGVPTGSRTVTASAPGFDSANANTNVSENQTSNVDFVLDPAPVGSQAIVECITYRSSGGQNQDRNLFIDITITDDGGAPVAGATVAISVDLDGSAFGTGSATTDSSGQVTFQAKNSPNGCFVTDVTSVSAAGLTFDGAEPLNGFAKGSDASPDPDCRTGSDGCGAG